MTLQLLKFISTVKISRVPAFQQGTYHPRRTSKITYLHSKADQTITGCPKSWTVLKTKSLFFIVFYSHSLQNIPADYLVQFFIGAQSVYDTEIDLYVEKHDFDDLLRFSLPDTYENLVFKTHAMLAWQKEFCSEVRYLIKVDGLFFEFLRV